ncbi:MAG: TolC family protein [Bacteroidetes bacterium]|nr:TolC family protein [Bacteroidota bacterium]
MSRNITKAITLLLFSLYLLVQTVKAQDGTQSITLANAITAAVNNNRNVQLAKLDESIAASNYKQTEAVYLPQLAFSYTAMSTNNPLNAFGFKLQEKLITQNDFDPSLLNHPPATPDFTTKIELQQPIVNMDLWYQRKAAAAQIDLYKLKTQRTKEYISFEVQKAYGQLELAYDAVRLLDEALKTTQALFTFTKNRYDQGLLQKSDLLNTQVQVTLAENNLSKAKNNIRTASDYLGLLMGQKGGVTYMVEPAETETKDTVAALPAARADFAAMQKAIEATDLAIKSKKMSYLPKLNAFGAYQLNDNHMLGFGANAYLAGIQLSWNIFKGNSTKNAIATQTLERNKLSEQLTQQKEQSQLELDKAQRDLADANEDINRQQQAIAQAQEALTILRNRYQQGLVNTTDVLFANTQLVQQQFALSQARFNAGITKAYIQFLTTTAQ